MHYQCQSRYHLTCKRILLHHRQPHPHQDFWVVHNWTWTTLHALHKFALKLNSGKCTFLNAESKFFSCIVNNERMSTPLSKYGQQTICLDQKNQQGHQENQKALLFTINHLISWLHWTLHTNHWYCQWSHFHARNWKWMENIIAIPLHTFSPTEQNQSTTKHGVCTIGHWHIWTKTNLTMLKYNNGRKKSVVICFSRNTLKVNKISGLTCSVKDMVKKRTNYQLALSH